MFSDFLGESGFFAPAIDSDRTPATTWTSLAGLSHTMDYILLSPSLQRHVSKYGVLNDIADLLHLEE